MNSRPEVTLDLKQILAQVFDLFLVHAEVVGYCVQHSETNFFAQLFRIGKILYQGLGKNRDFTGEERRVEAGSIGKRNALIKTVQGIATRIETFRA